MSTRSHHHHHRPWPYPSPFPRGYRGVAGPPPGMGALVRPPAFTSGYHQPSLPSAPYIPPELGQLPVLPTAGHRKSKASRTVAPKLESPPVAVAHRPHPAAPATPAPTRVPRSLPGPKYTPPTYRPPTVPATRVPEKMVSHLSTSAAPRWEFELAKQLPDPSPITVDGSPTRQLPPLPPLREDLFDSVLTHTSWAALKSHKFEEPEGNPMVDYERLEHLGDAVLGACITDMIVKLFPKITPGAATILKANLVNNKDALSVISTCYHLHTKLRTSPTFEETLRALKGVRAELFEAYLAGVFKQYGLLTARKWIEDLFGPIAVAGYDQLMAKNTPSTEKVDENVGFRSLLSAWCNQKKRAHEWIDGTLDQPPPAPNMPSPAKVHAFMLIVEKANARDRDGRIKEEGWHKFGPMRGKKKRVVKNALAAQAARELGIVAEIS